MSCQWLMAAVVAMVVTLVPLVARADECADPEELVACDDRPDSCAEGNDWVRKCSEESCFCRLRPKSLDADAHDVESEGKEDPHAVANVVAGMGGSLALLGGLGVTIVGAFMLASEDGDVQLSGAGYFTIGLGLVGAGAGLIAFVASHSGGEATATLYLNPAGAGVVIRF